MNWHYYGPTLFLFLVFGTYLTLGALWHMSHPEVIDYFYNQTLHMWEPVYLTPISSYGGVWVVVGFLFGLAETWFALPGWLFILSVFFVLWCVLLVCAPSLLFVGGKNEARRMQ